MKKDDVYALIEKNATWLAALIVVAVLVIPMSPIVLDILLIVDVLAAVAVFIYSKVKFSRQIAKFILFAAVFSLAVNVSLTRNTLTAYSNGSHILIAEVSSDLLKSLKYLIPFVIALLLFIVQVIVVFKKNRVAEILMRYGFDLNVQMYKTDSDFNEGLISKESADEKKEKISEKINLYSDVGSAVKFLWGCVWANIFIVAVNILAGMIIQIVIRKVMVLQALDSTAFFTSGIMIAMSVPMIILSMAARISVSSETEDK